MSDAAKHPPGTDPDLELLRAARDGDAAAFRALIDRHAASLSRLALQLSHNRADADDVVQETLLGAYRGMNRFGGRSLVKTWLMHILTRQARKAWRRGRRFRGTGSISAAPDAADEVRDAKQPDSHPPDEDLLRAVEALRPAQRDVLVLRELQGLSLREVAEKLHLPRGTVESRLTRARAELRRRLRGRGGGGGKTSGKAGGHRRADGRSPADD